ncbi:gEgh 16 protein [Ceratobasidium sp. AG-Ba]|nr:gEgh 16 protein [Ceratobasidium sp. AG-Ba]
MYTRIFYLSALASLVAAHGVITEVKGANGVTGIPMGVDTTTPRDGTRANPFQRDTSIIRDREIQSGKVGPCGRTNQAGAIDIASEIEGKSINEIIH